MQTLILLAVFNIFAGAVEEPVPDVGDSAEVVQEEAAFDFLEIYPQPTHDILFVALTYSFGEEVRIEIFDVLGIKIHAEVLDAPRTAIDVSDFPRGVYFLSAATERSGHLIRKVIIY